MNEIDKKVEKEMDKIMRKYKKAGGCESIERLKILEDMIRDNVTHAKQRELEALKKLSTPHTEG